MAGLITSPGQVLAALKPCRHIFLLSHMRAYTSLFGHIMGSNPAICGYYEMHIGYHSWKSLVRQKLLYFKDEPVKPGFSCMFDKVLHTDHDVRLAVLEMDRTSAIFCLRHPQQAIPSILSLYGKVDPTHEFNSENFAARYYIGRAQVLMQLASSMSQPFFYMDAESLKFESKDCLEALSNWLQLSTPLSPDYELQKKTALQRFGDSSNRMSSGTITADENPYAGYQSSSGLMDEAIEAYQAARTALIERSAQYSIYREAK